VCRETYGSVECNYVMDAARWNVRLVCQICFQADSLIFKDRKLNVGPAIRKQVSTHYAAAVAF